MTHVLKSIFVTLMLTLALNFTFGQNPIEIKYNPATHRLNLSDGEVTDVNWVNRRNLVWFTRDPYISKFEIVGKASNTWSIFDYRQQSPGQIWFEHVKGLAHPGDWKYSIIWYHGNERQPVHDPKIAVKPVGTFTAVVLIFGVTIAFMPALVFFKKKRKTERKLEEMTQKYEDILKSKT